MVKNDNTQTGLCQSFPRMMDEKALHTAYKQVIFKPIWYQKDESLVFSQRRGGQRGRRTAHLLVDFLRNDLGLTGTHVGCDTSQCGACVVHVDGRSIKSCTLLAVQAEDTQVTTIEGLADGDTLHPMQAAFREEHGLQCGFCTPGMIMSAVDLFAEQRRSDGKGDPGLAGRQPVPVHGLSGHRQVDTNSRAIAVSTARQEKRHHVPV